jgi:ATP-binding cassette subfamily F protein 3
MQRIKQAERTRPLRVELQQVEARLARLATEKAEVETALGDAATPAEDFAELGRRLTHIAAENHLLEERWLALHAELDTLGTAG